jgi:hypothetical protein
MFLLGLVVGFGIWVGVYVYDSLDERRRRARSSTRPGIDPRVEGDAPNVCEHGDHAAPRGRRFCSEACMECEHLGPPCSVECLTQRAEDVLQRVCELPRRTSPEGQPEVLLVTAAELWGILAEELGLFAEEREIARRR